MCAGGKLELSGVRAKTTQAEIQFRLRKKKKIKIMAIHLGLLNNWGERLLKVPVLELEQWQAH